MDTHKRTVLKTITWRIVATLTTVLVIYLWTNSWSLALGSGLVTNALKTIFYYIHERIWNLVNFGRRFVSGKSAKSGK